MYPGRLSTHRVAALAASLLYLASCGGSADGPKPPPPPDPEDAAPDPEDAAVLALSVDVDILTIDVPPNSRPHAPRAPSEIPLEGWKKSRTGFVTKLPIRTRNFYFHKPSPGMEVRRADGTEVPAKYFKAKEDSVFWSYTAQNLEIHGLSEAPAPGEFVFKYPRATGRETKLNYDTSGYSDPRDFVRTTMQAGAASRSGLLLPAPGSISWEVVVPPNGELRFQAALIDPEFRDGPPSDGATVKVELVVDGETIALSDTRVTKPDFLPVAADLSAYAGKTAELRIETDPGADPRFDYVFLADPVLATRKNNPRRVFLVIIDTLRVDHVGAFGYERDTTPALDAISTGAARFSQTRSVAPWTLPSTRSILTGNDPEFYMSSKTLQGYLREDGFATAMFAGNLYLGANFHLNRDWGLHQVDLLPDAKDQLDRSLAWLDAQEGRDVAMLVHLMDPHLPYKEPDSYRTMYAGPRPERIKADVFHRNQLLAWGARSKPERQYIRDRYDNNIRYADDQLQRLYDRLLPDDILVVFSDHGEEFWDHGGFEHGHTLFDELLRVPMVIKAPGIEGMDVDVPVSLLDLAPTVLDLLDIEYDGIKGSSLVPVMTGEAGAAEALTSRPQAFGRPLYGKERWGVLSDGIRKWSTIEGKEAVFDIAEDAFEKTNLVGTGTDTEFFREELSEALGTPVVPAYRISPRAMRGVPKQDLQATITVPGGVKQIWVGADPTEQSAAEVDADFKPGAETAQMGWPRPYRGPRDVWVVPERSLSEVTHELEVQLYYGTDTATLRVPEGKPASPDGRRDPLANTKVGERGVVIGFGYTPLPREGQDNLSGRDDELMEGLKAMGYVE
jgi:arylsulfatase A-like enzyme